MTAVRLQHFIIRIGSFEGNWKQRSEIHTWGFPEKTDNVHKLHEAVKNKTAIIWFLSPKDQMKNEHDGRIIAFCRPTKMFKRVSSSQAPSDEELNWKVNRNTCNTLNQESFDWRLSLGKIINIPKDKLLTYDALKRIHAKHISQRSIHPISRESLLHLHFNLRLKKHLNSLRRIVKNMDK